MVRLHILLTLSTLINWCFQTLGIPEAGLPDLHQYKYPDAEYKNSGLAIKLSDGIAKGFDTFYIDNIK